MTFAARTRRAGQSLPVVQYTLSGTLEDVVLVDQMGNPTTPALYRVTIPEGSLIGNVNASAALQVGQFPAGSTIEIINYGSIQGRGAIYGVRNGGDAIRATWPGQTVKVINKTTGKIYPGGGHGHYGGVGGAGGQGGYGLYNGPGDFLYSTSSPPSYWAFGDDGNGNEYFTLYHQGNVYYGMGDSPFPPYEGENATVWDSGDYGKFYRGSAMGLVPDPFSGYMLQSYQVAREDYNLTAPGGEGGAGGLPGTPGKGRGYEGPAGAAGPKTPPGAGQPGFNSTAGAGGAGGEASDSTEGGDWGSAAPYPSGPDQGERGQTGQNGDFGFGQTGQEGQYLVTAYHTVGASVRYGTTTVAIDNEGDGEIAGSSMS